MQLSAKPWIIVKMSAHIQKTSFYSIVGYDGISLGKLLEPHLTTYKQDTDKIGSEAAKQLVSLIERPLTTLIEVINVKGQLIISDSVGEISG